MALRTCPIAIVCVLIASSWALADTIILKSGERIEGRIALRGPDEVRIETQNGIRKIRTSEILEIIDDQDRKPRAPEDLGPGEPPAEMTPKPHASCADCGAKGLKLCASCGGLWKAAKRPQQCKRCDGTGGAVCPRCHATGRARCDACGGAGTVRKITGYNQTGVMKVPVFSDVTCTACQGARKIECPTKHKNAQYRINCEGCSGKGSVLRRVPCGDCNQGYVYCENCAVLHRLLRENREIREFFQAANVAARERLEYVTNGGKTITCNETADRLRMWLAANDRSPSHEIKLIRQNEAALNRWFRNLPTMLARNVQFFTPDIPLEVCRGKDGDVLLMKGVVPEISIRGAPATSEARAKEVAKAIATPFFYSLDQVLVNSPFASFAVVVLYGKQNFSDIPEGRIQPEAFAIIVDAEAARLLVRGEITEQAFYKRAQFYCADRDRGLAMGLIRTEFQP